MIVLDTNVISELAQLHPEPAVSAWFLKQRPQDLATTAISLAEVLYGLNLLPNGKRRDQLTHLSAAIFNTALRGRLLPFDETAAQQYGRLLAARRRRGAPMASLDAQIAAIALAANGSIATRNVEDFKHCGVTLINPWDA